jgi:hypothetical protein
MGWDSKLAVLICPALAVSDQAIEGSQKSLAAGVPQRF